MEYNDLFSDDLGSGMLDGLADLGSSENTFGGAGTAGGGASNNSQRGGSNVDSVMQSFNNQPPSYTQIGQGMAPPSKMNPVTPGYPEYSYGQYGTAVQPNLSYGTPPGVPGGGGPSRPMPGYPTYHQGSNVNPAASMHYQEYSVQAQGMLRSGSSGQPPPQQHAAPPPRMVTPPLTPQQQQFGGYRQPTQDPMYVQQLQQRWNEQQSYGGSLPHHYPANAASGYRQPHAYPSNLPRPPQPSQSQQQQQSQPTPHSQQQQSQSASGTPHNIPYMTRQPGPTNVMSQPQYGQGMYPGVAASTQQQYPDYHHSANSVGRVPSAPVPSGTPTYSPALHSQQQYNIPTPTHNQYANQYGQYYSGQGLGGAQGQPQQQSQQQAQQSQPPPGSTPNQISSAYPGSYPGSSSVNVNQPIPNGSPSYRPGYAQLPQLSPRQPNQSPRPPAPSPRPAAATTPVPASPQNIGNSNSGSQAPPQNSQPSSLQQLEQMVMPHVNKSSPSPKPHMPGGVMSPLGGPKTPMSPGVGPKTPLSPTQWQTPPTRPTQPSVNKSQYHQQPNSSPSGMLPHIPGHGGGNAVPLSPLTQHTSNNSIIESTGMSSLSRSHETELMDLGNLSSSMDTTDCPMPSVLGEDSKNATSLQSSGADLDSAMNSLNNQSLGDASKLGDSHQVDSLLSGGAQSQNGNQGSMHDDNRFHHVPSNSSIGESSLGADSGMGSMVSSVENSQVPQQGLDSNSGPNSSSNSLGGNSSMASLSNSPSVPGTLTSLGTNSYTSQAMSSVNSNMNNTISSSSGSMSTMSGPIPSPMAQSMGMNQNNAQQSSQPPMSIANNMMSGYGTSPLPNQTSMGHSYNTNGPGTPGSNSRGSMMASQGPLAGYQQRFPPPVGDTPQGSPGAPPPQQYMPTYHPGVGSRPEMYPSNQYPGAPLHSGPPGMRPVTPGQYSMPPGSGPPGIASPLPPQDRYHYEIHQLQQQLQHFYSLPPSPQTQMQIGELQERLRNVQQSQQVSQGMAGTSPYPPGIPPQMGGPPGYQPPMPIPQTMSDSLPPDAGEPFQGKTKKKKERKPREPKAGKSKKAKGSNSESLDASGSFNSMNFPGQAPHEVYDFQDVPPEVPEKKAKKPRKPRENKSPKEKKPKEPKPAKEKTPKRSRKKKVEPEPSENAVSVSGDLNDTESSVKPEDLNESDQKNGIGAAGIIAAEGGSSANISGGDGDTSTQDGTTIDAVSSLPTVEQTTPKPAKKKKPKLKSTFSSKKKPSKTMIALSKNNKKKRKRSDSEGSDLDATPPPSPPPEDDSSNKRRSARNTKRKKYTDDIDLALSEEELLMPLPSEETMRAIEAVGMVTPTKAGESPTSSTPGPAVDSSSPTKATPVAASASIDESSNSMSLNKPNFVFVNPAEEDTMIVQHILSVRMGKREIVPDSSSDEDDDEEETKQEEIKSENDKVEISKSEDNPPDLTASDSKQQEETDLVKSEVASNGHVDVPAEIPNESEVLKNETDVEKNAVKPEHLAADDSAKAGLVDVSAEELKKSEPFEATAEAKPDKVEEGTDETSKITEQVTDGETNAEVTVNGSDAGENKVVDTVTSSDEKDAEVKPSSTECESVSKTEPTTGDTENVNLNSEGDTKLDDATCPEPKPEDIKESGLLAVVEGQDDSKVQKKKKKQKRESQTIEVEEFYVKYKNFSYLHCEWKTEEEIAKGDKRAGPKIKRFKQKMNQKENIFEFLEEEPFNPEYTEVDRILDMSEVRDPSTGNVQRNYLVKWRALPYDECTWELHDDIDPQRLEHFHRFYKPPPKDQWKSKKRPKGHEWVKLDKSPVYKNNNTLREYQLEGLNWLSFSWYNGRNCILADEMGLGKTIQSLAFVDSVHRYGIRGPFLVIAPLSTVPNWQREFETWTDLNVVVYHGSVASRNMIQEYELFYRHPDNPQMNIKDVYKFNVLITTFEIVLTDVMDLKDFPWKLCVIDEAHRLKNKNCKLLEGLRMLNLEHRVLLSGTPLQNNINELFSLLNFLEPAQFASDEHFVKEFGELKTDTQCQKLQALLKPMMLRRLKEDVEKSIAPKEETIIEVELTNIQKKYYRGILERNFSFLSKGTNSANIPNLMNTMMELRKCCIHPYLLNGAEEQIQWDYKMVHDEAENDPDLYHKALVSSSGKMVLVDKLLPKLKANGHRVLIFSQMVRCLDILEDYLIFRKYPYERLDGRIRGPVRQAAIDRFSKPDSDRFVFLLCTKAGGLGINLTAADTVIIYDSDWNPQNDLQAQARCHRIGQAKMVKIYRLICRNTYEREMFDRASLKLGLDKAVLQSMNTGGQAGKHEQPGKQLSKKEVEDLLKRGAYGALMDEDNAGDNFCEEDIDCILQRRTQIITLETGEKGSTFSKASFAASGNREDINIDDPDFWKKWARKADIDVDEDGQKNELVIHEPRRRTQIKRYGHDEGVMDISDLESSSTSDEEGGVGERTRARGRKCKGGMSQKPRRSRRQQDEEFHCDDGVVEYGRWSRSECYKIEKGLLTYGWQRWPEILNQGQFRKGWAEKDLEDCSRIILLHCVKNFKGDEKVKSFVLDLIAPPELGGTAKITRMHSGLSNPVSRGGRKNKKSKRGKDAGGGGGDSNSGTESKSQPSPEPQPENDDWTKDEKYDADVHLDGNYKKHLTKHSNKVLLRIRMLYYIKQEIIGDCASKIAEGVPLSELQICPPTLVVDSGPTPWWDRDADASLLVGTYKHGYERYNMMRMDPNLCFLARCGPPDGSAVLAEISSEINEEEMDKAVENEEEENEGEAVDANATDKTPQNTSATKDSTIKVVPLSEKSNNSGGSIDEPIIEASQESKNSENKIDNSEREQPMEDKPTEDAAEIEEVVPKVPATDSTEGSTEIVETKNYEPENSEKTVTDPCITKEPVQIGENEVADDAEEPMDVSEITAAVVAESTAAIEETSIAEESAENTSTSPKPVDIIKNIADGGTSEEKTAEEEELRNLSANEVLPEEKLEISERMETSEQADVPSEVATLDPVTAPDSTTNPEEVKPDTCTEILMETEAAESTLWPSVSDLNTRLRKLITSFQRNFKKEEIRNAQKAKRMERKEKIEQIVRERERQKLEIYQRRWSKKEEQDFYRTVSTFGIQYNKKEVRFEWSKFRAISRLDKKFDETLTEYYRAFYAMCKSICGKTLTDDEELDLIQVPVEPLSEEKARQTLEKIDLLSKIRQEIIFNCHLEERLKLCQPSLDMPEWWVPGRHDRDLLFGASRHGLGRTDLFYLNDPELSFREILRRQMAGEPLADPMELMGAKSILKPMSESEDKALPSTFLSKSLELDCKVIKTEPEEAGKQSSEDMEISAKVDAANPDELSISDSKTVEESIDLTKQKTEPPTVDVGGDSQEVIDCSSAAKQVSTVEKQLDSESAQKIVELDEGDTMKTQECEDLTVKQEPCDLSEKVQEKPELKENTNSDEKDNDALISASISLLPAVEPSGTTPEEAAPSVEPPICASADEAQISKDETPIENGEAVNLGDDKSKIPVEEAIGSDKVSQELMEVGDAAGNEKADVETRTDKVDDVATVEKVSDVSIAEKEDETAGSKNTDVATDIEKADTPADEKKCPEAVDTKVSTENDDKQTDATGTGVVKAEDLSLEALEKEKRDENGVVATVNELSGAENGANDMVDLKKPASIQLLEDQKVISEIKKEPVFSMPMVPVTLPAPPALLPISGLLGAEGNTGLHVFSKPTGSDAIGLSFMGELGTTENFSGNQMNLIKWPRDKAIQIRLEHIVHCVEKGEWPVSRFFSSAPVTELHEFTPQITPEVSAAPARDAPTPISECSDLAPPEDLIMSLPSTPSVTLATTLTTQSTATTPTPIPAATSGGRRGRRRRIAIDVETERAKLQALLTHSMHNPNILSHSRGGSGGRGMNRGRDRDRHRERELERDRDRDQGLTKVRLDEGEKEVVTPLRQSKFPPPAHQHHSPASLLRSTHQQQQFNQPPSQSSRKQHQHQHQHQHQQSHQQSEPTNFSTRSQSSSLDLSVKPSNLNNAVAAAAMSALSSLSSVTVTPVTLNSPPTARSKNNMELSSSSTPMDLSGSVSKMRHKELPQSLLSNDKLLIISEEGEYGGKSKQLKLENMLDKLRKRKGGPIGEMEPPPTAGGKEKRRKKLDDIVLGLSAAKGQSVFSPPISRASDHGKRPPSAHSAHSAHSPASSQQSQSQFQKEQQKQHQQLTSNIFSNPLLSATLSLFNSNAGKELHRLAQSNQSGGHQSSSNNKQAKDTKANAGGRSNQQKSASRNEQNQSAQSLFLSGLAGLPSGSQLSEMPKCDLNRLAELAVPKFDLFSHDAKVNKWLAEHANLTPERPVSPEFLDGRRRRRPRVDPMLLNWDKLSGDENVPVVNRLSGKKVTGPKAPQLKQLGQWLLENPMYDVDPKWADLVREKGNLPTDLHRRITGEKKKGPGRPPLLTSPPPVPTSSAAASVPTSSANAYSSLGAFSSIPGLQGLNPNLLASLPLGSIDPKNPLFMPFGGLGSLGNLGNLGSLGNLSSLTNLSSLGLTNPLFGFGLPQMQMGSDMSGVPEKSTKESSNAHTSSSTPHSSTASKKEEKAKKSSGNSSSNQNTQNMLSNALPFLFPNPGLMYNPLGLGSFPLGSGMPPSFGNFGQSGMVNGINNSSGGGSGKKSGGNKSGTNSLPNPLAGLAGLNIPAFNKKESAGGGAMSGGGSSRNKFTPVQPSPHNSSMVNPDDSDDESMKSLMGNHADDLPDDDEPAGENTERIILKESKELEKEMAQQKMETRREKRERMRDPPDSHRGLTAAERQLLMVKKKERLAKEDSMPTREPGRTTRRSAAAASRSRLEEAVHKMREASESHGGGESSRR